MSAEELAGRLVAALETVLGPGVSIEALERLSGGASRETWRFDAIPARVEGAGEAGPAGAGSAGEPSGAGDAGGVGSAGGVGGVEGAADATGGAAGAGDAGGAEDAEAAGGAGRAGEPAGAGRAGGAENVEGAAVLGGAAGVGGAEGVAIASGAGGGGGAGAEGRVELILRRDPPQRPGPEGGMGREAQAISAAGAAGLAVPSVLVADPTGEVLGSAGMVMTRVAGETIARKVLRDDAYAAARPRLARQCGEFLARLHQLPVDAIGGLADEDALTAYRGAYDLVEESSATFELAFRWLEARRPPTTGRTIVHGDFRLGNLIVDGQGLAAVLDWELVHRGDPVEDLGWLCTKAWRFGAEPPVGGFGEREDLLAAYAEAGGTPVSPETLAWWEAVGTLKWGVICMAQASVHLTGLHRSIELAAIGRRVCEQEADLLAMIAPDQWAAAEPTEAPSAGDDPGLHGRPTAVELLDALQGFLEQDVSAATTGRVRFHTRVATRVVAMVARELELGPAQQDRYREGLARFGVTTEQELADAVRRGDLDHRTGELATFLSASVKDKLAVAHP